MLRIIKGRVLPLNEHLPTPRGKSEWKAWRKELENGEEKIQTSSGLDMITMNSVQLWVRVEDRSVCYGGRERVYKDLSIIKGTVNDFGKGLISFRGISNDKLPMLQ